MWPKPITPCRCETGGFCVRHNCKKPYELVLQCRLNWAAFELWETGQGLCLDRARAELAKHPAATPEFVDLPRCRQRGAEPLQFVECALCGGQAAQVPIYSCALLGKCTPRRYGTRTEVMRTMPSCARCDHYEAAQSTSPETVSTA